MRRLLLRAPLLVAALTLVALVSASPASAAAPLAPPVKTADDSQIFFSIMNGAQQVPAVQSNGIAASAFEVAPDKMSIRFQIAAKNLTSDIQAGHIHLGAKGVNGPVVVNLIKAPASGKAFFMEGTFTPADQVGPLAGEKNFDKLLAAMSSGGAYTNIHTKNFPAGEVRGQIHQIDD
jgi:CHRD domain-containing protein